MPKVTHVKKARKPIGDLVKRGQSYYWWKFKGCRKSISLTPPKASQLTQSAFWSSVYSIQESNEECPEFEELESQLDSIKEELQSIADETQEKLDNMPYSLQEGPTGELLQGRIDEMERIISELDAIDLESGAPESEDDCEDDEKLQFAENKWSEVTDVLGSISCE